MLIRQRSTTARRSTWRPAPGGSSLPRPSNPASYPAVAVDGHRDARVGRPDGATAPGDAARASLLRTAPPTTRRPTAWRPPARRPVRLVAARGQRSVWTGEELIVVGNRGGPAAGGAPARWPRTTRPPTSGVGSLIRRKASTLRSALDRRGDPHDGHRHAIPPLVTRANRQLVRYDPSSDTLAAGRELVSKLDDRRLGVVIPELIAVTDADGVVRAVLVGRRRPVRRWTCSTASGNEIGTLPGLPADPATFGDRSATGGVWAGEEVLFYIRAIEPRARSARRALGPEPRDPDLAALRGERRATDLRRDSWRPTPASSSDGAPRLDPDYDGPVTGIVYRPPTPAGRVSLAARRASPVDQDRARAPWRARRAARVASEVMPDRRVTAVLHRALAVGTGAGPQTLKSRSPSPRWRPRTRSTSRWGRRGRRACRCRSPARRRRRGRRPRGRSSPSPAGGRGTG